MFPENESRQFSRTGNLLLDRLPVDEVTRIVEQGQRVAVPLRTVVTEAEQPSQYVYFPLKSVFSCIIPLRDGSMIEAATVGNEGMTGIDLLTSHPASIYRVIEQVEGESLQVPATLIRSMLAQDGAFKEVVQRYAMTVMHQSSQNAACNARHPVEERICRWLLMTHDRVRGDKFYLTQEFLAIMLGVRRQSVSVAASMLQEAGLITYRRGDVTILDRPGLERASCECYEAIQHIYQRIMG